MKDTEGRSQTGTGDKFFLHVYRFESQKQVKWQKSADACLMLSTKKAMMTCNKNINKELYISYLATFDGKEWDDKTV